MELEALLVCKLESEHAPPPSSEIVTISPAALILEVKRESKSPILDLSRDFERPVAQPLLKELGYALRRIEKRLDDIDARIGALSQLPPPAIPELNDHRATDTRSPPHEQGESLDDARDMQSASTAKLLHAPSRASLHETVAKDQDNLAAVWRKLQDRLGWICEAAAPLLAKLAKRAPNPETYSWPVNNLNRLGAADERQAGLFGARSTLVVASISSLLILGVPFLRSRPKAVDTAQKPPVHALDARDAAMAKKVALPKPLEVKVNSLQTTIALLSPTPVSGGVSENLAAPPNPGDSGDLAVSQSEPASPIAESAPQSDKELLNEQATVGDAAAQYDHATDLYKSGDIKGAVLWLEKSAKQGNAKAQLQLGNLYLKGNGVTRNLAQARKWLETAANNGNALAMHNLAVLYSGGEGRRPDLTRASDWFRRAAEQGVVDSMVNLGLAYSDGLGVERDLIQAYAWFSLAASKGDAKAAKKRKELGKLLDRDELSEAKTLTDSLKLTQRNISPEFDPSH